MRKNRRFRRASHDDATRELLRELEEMRAELGAAYTRFDAATEPELVDACVYEINAAQSRYNYLIRAIKEAGAEAALKACPGEEGSAAWA